MFSAEANGPCDERPWRHGSDALNAPVVARMIERHEPVAPKRCETSRADARIRSVRDAMPPAHVEIQPVADDQAATAGRLHVRPVPVAEMLGDGQERIAIGPRPVKAVAAVADADVIRLFADKTLASKDREQAEHDALVRDAVEVVEFRRDVVLSTLRVELVGGRPQHRLVVSPMRAVHPIAGLKVEAMTRWSGLAGSQAEYPYVAKRVVEERRAIARVSGVTGLRPVNAVGRDELLEVVVVPRRHLVAPRRIRLVLIDPRRRRIAVAVHDDVRAFDDVESRAVPVDAVC